MRVFLTMFTVLAIAAGALAGFKPVRLDTTHSKLGFTAETLLFDVEGVFKKFKVEVDGDPKKLSTARVKVTIDTASIDTDNGKRDEHLRAEDFFHASRFPKITFTSSKIEHSGNSVRVTGILDMHGKKKQVTIPFKEVRGKNGAGTMTTAYKGKLKIRRSDFGIGAQSVAAKLSLEDEVSLQLLLVVFL